MLILRTYLGIIPFRSIQGAFHSAFLALPHSMDAFSELPSILLELRLFFKRWAPEKFRCWSAEIRDCWCGWLLKKSLLSWMMPFERHWLRPQCCLLTSNRDGQPKVVKVWRHMFLFDYLFLKLDFIYFWSSIHNVWTGVWYDSPGVQNSHEMGFLVFGAISFGNYTRYFSLNAAGILWKIDEIA